MPLKLTQPRSKCFKATARITQVFRSLCWSFVLKRKRSLGRLFLSWFRKTPVWGGDAELRRPTPAILTFHLPPSGCARQDAVQTREPPAPCPALSGDPRVRSRVRTQRRRSEAASSQTQSKFKQRSPAFAGYSPPESDKVSGSQGGAL